MSAKDTRLTFRIRAELITQENEIHIDKECIKRNVKVEHVFGTLKLKCCADCTTAYESVSEPVLFVIKDLLGSFGKRPVFEGAGSTFFTTQLWSSPTHGFLLLRLRSWT
jgi:hypothetical protein